MRFCSFVFANEHGESTIHVDFFRVTVVFVRLFTRTELDMNSKYPLKRKAIFSKVM
jgi:hypothetical protein